MKTARILTLTTLLIISSAVFSFGQSALGTSAIPPRLEIHAKPGTVVTREIKIRNESNSERFFKTIVKDFIVNNDRGVPVQIDNTDETTNRWAASSWIQTSPSQFKIKAGETKSLILTVIIPKNATPGGHYAMILHQPQTETSLEGSGASVTADVGTLVYLTIPGDIKEKAQIREFSIPQNFFEYGPIDFTTIIRNLSDIHLTPIGTITVRNWFSGKTASLGLDNTNIFPYTAREFKNTLNRKLLFGRYTANLEAAYGTKGQILTATLSFWVIPWRLLILVTATIVIILILINLLRNQPKSKITEIKQLEQELDDLKHKYKDTK